MPLEAWLPVGFTLPDGSRTRRVLQADTAWQIVETATKGRALIVTQELATRWDNAGLANLREWQSFRFGTELIYAVTPSPNSTLALVNDSRSPSNKNEALAFAVSLRETRAIDAATPLQESIYIEQLSRILPTYALSAPISDDVVLGSWLAGGVQVSVYSTRRIHQLLSWLGNSNLEDVIKQSGLQPASGTTDTQDDNTGAKPPFTIAGRPALEQFFNEHVIDLIEHADRYRALGIEFPSAIILHGPPGCGKTFAVERLVEYLGWPSFSIDATSIGSPYIHETSRKVAQVFDKAMKEAPSVLVIDEMEAFLSDREMGAASSHHRVEEVGEFLRRIPEAIHNRVLIVAMTNRLEMIDPAIQRRGRFDHVVFVGMPSRDEVEGLLKKLLEKVPTENLDIPTIANALTGRPLSDVAFVTREAARLAARSGRHSIDQLSLLASVKSAPSRAANTEPRKIGFT